MYYLKSNWPKALRTVHPFHRQDINSWVPSQEEGATALLHEQTQAGVGVQIAKNDIDDWEQCKITPRLTLEPARSHLMPSVTI